MTTFFASFPVKGDVNKTILAWCLSLFTTRDEWRIAIFNQTQEGFPQHEVNTEEALNCKYENPDFSTIIVYCMKEDTNDIYASMIDDADTPITIGPTHLRRDNELLPLKKYYKQELDASFNQLLQTIHHTDLLTFANTNDVVMFRTYELLCHFLRETEYNKLILEDIVMAIMSKVDLVSLKPPYFFDGMQEHVNKDGENVSPTSRLFAIIYKDDMFINRILHICIMQQAQRPLLESDVDFWNDYADIIKRTTMLAKRQVFKMHINYPKPKKENEPKKIKERKTHKMTNEHEHEQSSTQKRFEAPQIPENFSNMSALEWIRKLPPCHRKICLDWMKGEHQKFQAKSRLSVFIKAILGEDDELCKRMWYEITHKDSALADKHLADQEAFYAYKSEVSQAIRINKDLWPHGCSKIVEADLCPHAKNQTIHDIEDMPAKVDACRGACTNFLRKTTNIEGYTVYSPASYYKASLEF
jgi:hypothetical protein